MPKLLILIVLSFGLFWVNCSPKKTYDNFSTSQIKQMENIPYNTRFLIYMNIEKLKTSNLWKDNLKSTLPGIQSQTWLNKFEKTTGINLLQSISELYAADTDNDKNFKLLVLKSDNKIKNSFLNSDLFIKQNNSGKIFLSSKEGHTFFYFINDKLLATSSDSILITNLVSGKNLKLTSNQKFMKVANTNFNKKYYWFASDDNTYFEYYLSILSSSGRGLASELINSIESLTLSTDFKEESKIVCTVSCKDSKSAFLITSGAKSAISMGMLSHNDKSLEFMLNKLEIERIENNVNFNLKLTDDDIIKLKEIKNIK